MRTTVTSMANSWAHLAWYMVVVLTTKYTEASPTAITETRLSREDIQSLVYHILENSAFSEDLIKDEDESSSSDNSNKNTTSGTEKGAIIGGTIAAGIILGVTVFMGVLIYKQYRFRQQRAYYQANDAVQSLQKSPGPGTTSGNSTYRSWRHTFNHRVSIPDSASVYSQRSYGNSLLVAQVEMAPTRSIPPPTIPQKAAQMLGVEGVQGSGSAMPLIKSPLPSPHLPNSPLTKHFMPWNPLAQNPPQQHPLPQVPSVQTPMPTTREDPESSTARTRTSSNCTMSTLGRELLHDVMQPIPAAKASSPSEETTIPGSPPPISKTTRPPPVSMNNMKGQKRAPSRRYFVPLFKKNGQLLSPTSPDVGISTGSDIQEEEDDDGKVKAETVVRDSSRAGLFSLGENKI
ncbi:hypothetical protein FLONG3_11266 [Fusarium longipes]|uniref:Uncharacterized protein n=1 Tax=Fusarium longipes TaxID=694270 RepID=A0A395RH89_9HYPO|nr:hypothetical protein FLONG3_11266 [Fusarium longipes]